VVTRKRRPILRPPALGEGAVIGVCSPAGPVDPERLAQGVAWLEREGFRVRCAANVAARCGFLGGTDEQRLADLLELVRAPEVAAVMCSRGGYGVTRVLARLDPAELRRSRKLFIGHSDATALCGFLRERAGLASLHGPMLNREDLSPASAKRLIALLRGDPLGLEPLAGKPLRGGRASGPLVGGNLVMVAGTLGTPWEIDTRGAVLFLEEVSEQPYAIDRLLGQLRDAGKLAAAVGVAVGQLVQCESQRYPEPSAVDVVRGVLEAEVRGPVVLDLPFGHVADNHALAVGTRAELDGDRGELRLLEHVVAALPDVEERA
jgi:muramoyltetrapeptide carboxypeptidase